MKGELLMIVKISRSKLLINSQSSVRRARKVKKSTTRCNHCGGLVRNDGELVACIMCSRDVDHVCGSCAHVRASDVSVNKKSA